LEGSGLDETSTDEQLIVVVDELTGEEIAAPAALGGAVRAGPSAQGAAVAVPLEFVSEGNPVPAMLYVLILVAVLAGVFGVPIAVMVLDRRRTRP
jgi:hypothetical protein